MKEAKRFANQDERFTSTLFSFYSIDLKASVALEGAIPALSIKSKSWHPYGAAVAHMGKHETLRSDGYLTSALPSLGIFTDHRKLTLPEGEYLILYSPCIKMESRDDPYLAKRTITTVLGLLTIAIGKNAFLDHLTDQIIIPDSLQQSYLSKPIRIPTKDDFVYFTDATIITDVLEKIAVLQDDLKAQILYILDMFGRAVQEREAAFQFSLYWIALELISQTKGDGVAAKLGNAYGQNKTYVYETLEFRQVYNARHNFFHKGIFPYLSSRQERLVQCYFMDLLRERLRLPCKQLCLAALNAF